MPVGTDDDCVDLEMLCLVEDLGDGGALNQQCAYREATIPKIVCKRLKLPVFISDLACAMLFDGLWTGRETHEIGIWRHDVDQRQIGREGPGEGCGLLDDRLRNRREVDGCQNVSHDQPAASDPGGEVPAAGAQDSKRRPL